MLNILRSKTWVDKSATVLAGRKVTGGVIALVLAATGIQVGDRTDLLFNDDGSEVSEAVNDGSGHGHDGVAGAAEELDLVEVGFGAVLSNTINLCQGLSSGEPTVSINEAEWTDAELESLLDESVDAFLEVGGLATDVPDLDSVCSNVDSAFVEVVE